MCYLDVGVAGIDDLCEGAGEGEADSQEVEEGFHDVVMLSG